MRRKLSLSDMIFSRWVYRLIRFIYYIYNYRLLYYLPMERMAQNWNIEMSQAFFMEVWNGYERSKELEEENKKLKDEMDMAITHNLLLIKENKKLRADLAECECSFWFESDEVWFWKREYKRLKKWIKDHCKWYWNLFPEDEMKRQRKKADKKRKKSDLYKDVWLMEEDTLQELRDIGEI